MQFFPSFSVFLKIGSLEIHYYALCIITGALIAYELGQYRFKKLGYARNILSRSPTLLSMAARHASILYKMDWHWYLTMPKAW